jgi:hypothetical protein
MPTSARSGWKSEDVPVRFAKPLLSSQGQCPGEAHA